MKTEREMKEKDIEDYLRRRCKQNDIQCYKFTSPAHAGVPDRICIGHGKVIFVELKRPGGKPRELQVRTFEHMVSGGADVRVIDTKEMVDEFIKEVLSDGGCKDRAVGIGWNL